MKQKSDILYKALCYYLPYKLMVSDSIGIFELMPNHLDWTMNWIKEGTKPILKPLSELTDEYLSELNIDLKDDIILRELRDGLRIMDSVLFRLVELLISKHFDCFGLLEMELAIRHDQINLPK